MAERTGFWKELAEKLIPKQSHLSQSTEVVVSALIDAGPTSFLSQRSVMTRSPEDIDWLLSLMHDGTRHMILAYARLGFAMIELKVLQRFLDDWDAGLIEDGVNSDGTEFFRYKDKGEWGDA